MAPWEDFLRQIYYDPSHPASYEGRKALYNAVKKDGRFRVSHSQIKKWLQNQSTYSLNKAVKRNFTRGRVIVSGIDDQWDADLASFSRYEDANDGYRYLLVVIDIFSRYAWVEPIKDKSARRIVAAFNRILSKGRSPRRLRSDAARDFTSKIFQRYLKTQKIAHFTTHTEKQANYVERFIKTLKGRIWRHMRATNSSRYIDVLQDLVNSYNRAWHSGIKSEPINVNKENESKLWWQMYWPKSDFIKQKEPKIEFLFKVGDRVRISYLRSAFQREYDIKWSGEIFKVTKRFVRQGQPIYKIVDWYNNPVEGTFYQKELQKVYIKDTDTWKIEKILKYKGTGRNKLAKVRWLNWPKKFDSWIYASEIEE